MVDRLQELLAHRERLLITDTTLRQSAVLVPLFIRDGAYHILFIRRSLKVETHKGEISFPGGLCEAGDRGLEGTALREAFEEIGLAPHRVKVLGLADDMATVSTSYRVTPVVGLIPYPYDFRISADEVAEIITIPLLHLRAGERGREESITRGGKTYTGYTYHYRDSLIWGATARIVQNVLTLWNAVMPLADRSNSP